MLHHLFLSLPWCICLLIHDALAGFLELGDLLSLAVVFGFSALPFASSLVACFSNSFAFGLDAAPPAAFSC
jgi:hypothetical protein